MATRQKSFFDQTNTDKPRRYPQNWSRGKAEAAQQPSPAPPKPPIAASPQAVSRLSVFKYQADNNSACGMGNAIQEAADKENVQPRTKESRLTPSHATSKEPVREFPSTPAGRVPLADLIGNAEDHAENTPGRSPVEAVSWHRSPRSSNESLSYMTPVMRKNKKRARSTSPSSQQTATAKQSFDLQNLQASLKTPQNDPAVDLEHRYFARSMHHTPSKPSSSAAPDFMHSSSPQTPAISTVDSAKLKRTMSCGMAYPSGNKRRKTSNQGALASKRSPMPGTSKRDTQGELQTINFLLDSIHDELPSSLKSPLAGDPPFASSAPDREMQRHAASQPAKPITPRLSQRSLGGSQPLNRSRICSQESQESKHSSFSDYGGAEMDEALADISADAVSGVSQTRRDSPRPAVHKSNSQPDLQTDIPARTVRFQSPPAPNDLDDVTNNDDEFDDDDEEFEAGLEVVASMYESKITANAGTPQNHEMTPTDDRPPQLPVDESLLGGDPYPRKAVIEILSDDEFDEGIDDDFCDGLYQATQADEPAKTKARATIQRYLIVSVSDGSFELGARVRPEKVLHVQDEKKQQSRAVILRDSWFDSPCAQGSFIHVLGDFDKKGQCVIDDAQNWLLIHPDHLISATVVADSFSCVRRAVLQDRVKATSSANEAQVYGHILHEVFQEAMRANRWDTQWLAALIEQICARYLESLYEINIDIPLAVNHLMTKASKLQAWAKLFVAARPNAHARVQDRNGGSLSMSINKLLDVEEHVWSPKFGLKGNIDATVQVTMQENGDERTLTVPFEVKTGRNTSSIAHQAQTALYTLLLSDRYGKPSLALEASADDPDIEVTYGILYYLENSETSRIVGIRLELLNMIKQRNLIASYVYNRQELPPMLQDARMCGKCYAQKSCFVYHRLAEDGDGKTSGLKAAFMQAVSHLKPAHKDFFKKWDTLLSKEEADAFKLRRELWTMLSSEREKVGRCFGGLVIEPGSAEELSDAPKINRFKYSFAKQKQPANFSFTESQITVGEPIVISDEKGHYALANGYVISVRQNRISVAVDRRLHNARIKSKRFDAARNQSFAGIMRVVEDGEFDCSSSLGEPSDAVLYRLDKDEFSNGMATVRNNLIRLMDGDLFGSDNLRKLIVDHAAPQFDAPKKQAKEWISASQSSLNVDQQNAVEKVMSAKDYALVLGMPGTGKTTTIAHIIRALTAMGKSVLLTSYTHTAVDNILLKIRSDNIPVLRLGAIAKVHPEVQAFADLASAPKASFQELERSYSAQVVATTCLGINHPIFNTRIFDYCIVDEASQITLPVCLGPIAMARRFVLVGDHYQLPPLVQNKEAAEGGLDVSLFKLLSDVHPESVVNLEHQYRMCEEIMSLSNTLIYDGRLKCGTSAVASQALHIPAIDALKQHHHSATTLPPGQTDFCPGPALGSCWLRDTLDPGRRVVFLNTDKLGLAAREIVSGSRITNPLEVSVTTQVVEALIAVGIPAGDVGVITLYRSQLALLKHSLRQRASSSYAAGAGAGGGAGAVEMHTADKFQGRDKEAIVLSLVRSSDEGGIGELLADWRRVNVALTRARTKLVLVGSLATMSRGSDLLARFCALCRAHGWVYSLGDGALQAHYFDEWRSQAQSLHKPDAGKRAAEAEAEDVQDEQDEQDEERAAAGLTLVESDLEVGPAGKSPRKSSQGRSSAGAAAVVMGAAMGTARGTGRAGGRGKENALGSSAADVLAKPAARKFPAKQGRTNPRRLLGSRPVLRDVVNDVLDGV